jgi:hypothetical protein
MNQGKNAKPLGTGAGGRGRGALDLPGRDVVAIQDELVVQKSAEKLDAVGKEGSTSPLPERVLLLKPLFFQSAYIKLRLLSFFSFSSSSFY